MQINKETELKQLKQESEKCTVHLKEQINELRKEKINCEMENEKLTFINEQNLKESLNLKSDFEKKNSKERLTDTCDITFRDNDSDLKFPSKEASESQSVAIQKLPQVNKKSGNDNAKAVNFDFLFLHDSICNFIDIRKLLSGSVYEGIKHTSYTVEKTREIISSLQHARTLLLHVGINNLKKESADAVVRKFVLMVDEALKKVDTVIISLVVPTKYSELNEKIKNFNNQLYNHLYYADNIHFCSHDNFSHHGQVLPHLYQDCFRLSRDQGIRVLASNIRNILFPRSSRRSVNNHNRGTNHYYQSQNKDKYVRSEAMGNHQNYSYNEGNTNWSFHEPVQAQLTEDHKYNAYGNSQSIQLPFKINIRLSETHASSKDILALDGYKCHVNCRSDSNKSRGGLAVFIRKEILTGIKLIDNSVNDIMWLKLDKNYFGLTRDFFLYIYISPANSSYTVRTNCDKQLFDKLYNDVAKYGTSREIMLLGDLNAHVKCDELDFITNEVDDTFLNF
ncbi:unnamed protein product [Mytilus edulis]|uniref:Endonuclease/exonuclease/phosphatase domain-containing protein n=1 Tax=Mytilus edulis TaxID=6550 RepID=A0A8S3ULN8_MYTED|nr:unnamed protein product [Mytilus edulis]